MKQEAGSLEDLQKQWPIGMLQAASTAEGGYYLSEEGRSGVASGQMMKDGRFVFLLVRCWGDLQKLIDLRMQHNGNQAPPFSSEKTWGTMYTIAVGMRGLHNDNIMHRDLKASNVLIWPSIWNNKDPSSRGDFDPVSDGADFVCYIADFESSVGVVGTRFWRAPEILRGVKNRNHVQFTEKSDV